jgi:predicted TIM-barrel fold metal-dependent hydrolase
MSTPANGPAGWCAAPDPAPAEPMIDCDNHCYEARDSFTRYLPTEYLDQAVTTVVRADGSEAVMAGDRVAVFNTEPGGRYERAPRPGSLKEMLRRMATADPDDAYQLEPMRPEYVDRQARLRLMDNQGVDKAIIYPAAGALACEQYIDNTGALYANIHSFNRWYHETWGFQFRQRIYAPALLSLRSLEHAVEELDFVLGEGARLILLPAGPAYGRSPGDRYFDPFWARINEAGATVAFHIMSYWYNEHISPAWGQEPEPRPWQMSAWQWQNTHGERPIQEVLSALIFDNVLGRFPDINVVVSEFGAEWVPHFVRHMDKSRGMGRGGPWPGGPLPARPSAIFRERVRVVPYPEDDIVEIVRQLGHCDCLVMGSDFPHAEGLDDPARFAELIADLSIEDQAKILSLNAAPLFAG